MNIPLNVKQHKKAILIGGVAVVLVFFVGVRWVSQVSESRAYAKKMKKMKEEANAVQTPTVTAFLVKKVNFVDNLVMTGNLQGGARVELRFDREGRISKINKRIGDRVEKGAVIAELDTGEAGIKLQQAEEELSQALDLYKSGAIAKPRLTQARLSAELARKEYGRSHLKAPFEGAIGEWNAEVGEYVTSQHTVATLVSSGKVYVEMGVIEKDLSKLKLNQTVKIQVETYPGVFFEGKISNISPVVEGQSRTRTVRADLPNEKGLLLPGMFAKTEIFIREKPDALVIPLQAIKVTGDPVSGETKRAYVIKGKGDVEERAVKTSYDGMDYAEVAEGLAEGDRIVAQVSEKIRPGIKVEVIEETSYESR